MATTHLRRWVEARTVIDAATATTADPTASSDMFLPNSRNSGVVAMVEFTGSSTGTLQLWVEDSGQWYKGETASLSSSGGNVALMFPVFARPGVTFSLTAKSGGGSITVKIL